MARSKRSRTTKPRPGPDWQEAAAFAARKHRHQMRRDGRTPYSAHLTRVALTLAALFDCTDEVVLCAALLHDTIEDTTTDFDDILQKFGSEVAQAVSSLTKNMALPEKEREADYDARIAASDWRVKLIKLADAYDNHCDLDTLPPDQHAEQRRKSVDRCKRAISIARQGPDHPLLVKAAKIVETTALPARSRRGA